ncbi:hypothetical protein HKX48_007643 [Thoreauomyces humboldtii]|nr:hypothetical protein HKX48_007643 [Thoreauomyces humboldtii]
MPGTTISVNVSDQRSAKALTDLISAYKNSTSRDVITPEDVQLRFRSSLTSFLTYQPSLEAIEELVNIVHFGLDMEKHVIASVRSSLRSLK